MKHKGIDYKTSAVQYYLNNNESMDKVCKIFNCKKTTLKAWVHNYQNNKKLTRRNRKILQSNKNIHKKEKRCI
jgi:transposase-like protein